MQIFFFTHMITIGHGLPFTAGDVSSLACNLEQFDGQVKYARPRQFAELVRWSRWSRWLRWLALVIFIWKIYGLYGQNHQIIEKSCDVAPVTYIDVKVEQYSAQTEFAIKLF